eukprot:128570_1
MDFSRLKQINNKYHFLVYGYIRKMENILFHDMNIPKNIATIVLLFSAFNDEWDSNCIGKRMKIDPKTNILKIVAKASVCSYQSAYLKTICEPPYKYFWRFQIIKDDGINRYWNMNIGIWKINVGKPHTNSYFTATDHNGYAFIASDGILTDATAESRRSSGYKHYGFKCKTDDVIDMDLDLNTCILSYKINDKDFGVAYIVEKTKYRAAVTIDGVGNAIQLLD